MLRTSLIILILTLGGYPSSAQDKTYYVVASDGSGDFTTVQAAVDACRSFPDDRITVFIRNGIYREKIRISGCNPRLSLIGESRDGTIITWDDHFAKMERGKNSTFYTYTLMVEADDFHAENLTIENGAGPVGQAVALHVEGDRCVFRNCVITGHQDTLYASGQNSRQYFEECLIEGTTDFIFGAATALFVRCTINSKKDSYITAASTPQGKSFGFVFIDCDLTADEDVTKVFLGRPWRDYARVVFIRCRMGSHIRPEGWSDWAGTTRFKTAYYAEYGNTGPGAGTTQRVEWSKGLTRRQASEYTTDRILAPRMAGEPPASTWIRVK